MDSNARIACPLPQAAAELLTLAIPKPLVQINERKGLMSRDPKLFDKVLRHALSGTSAHVETNTVFDALDWKLAGVRPESAPHSVYQLLNHMVYWQGWVLKWLDGKRPPIPKHASGSWPDDVGPGSPEDWKRAVTRFQNGLEELTRRSRGTDLFSKGATKTRFEMLQTIASHNSYHAGQVVQLRQMLGVWPPPSGGLTW
jgi:uncharacterized damage-inducible protein DinB